MDAKELEKRLFEIRDEYRDSHDIGGFLKVIDVLKSYSSEEESDDDTEKPVNCQVTSDKS